MAQPAARLAVQQADNDAPRVLAHVVWEAQRVVQDSLVHRLDVLVVERRQARLGGSNVSHTTEVEARRRCPTIISKRSTPSVHQSTVFVYP